MKNKKTLYIILVIAIVICLTYYIYAKFYRNSLKPGSALTTSEIDTAIHIDNGDEKIDWSNYETQESSLSGNGMSITTPGVYTLTGLIDNGCVTVNTTGSVKLILDNVKIVNPNGPAIKILNADTTVIYLNENTENYLEDGSAYASSEVGVIYSKDDLAFDGTGSLYITSNNEDGIVSMDDLKFNNGTYFITSKDDAIRGKDSVYILNGNYTINALGDGIKSTNDTDSERGYVLISNGTFNITSTLDAIQAETKILIENGIFDITTGGGSANSSTTNSSWGMWGQSQKTNNDSAKGFKSKDNLVIKNGTFNFDTSDDAIHSNNYLGITNGVFNISSGDDAMHADTQIIIDGGQIDIKKSYEGIESDNITINDGSISLIASDDGINVSGGNDASGMNRPGANTHSNTSSNKLVINGGTIYVNSTGDGIDVNGSAYIYGGIITVDGPISDGDGALDYDGEFVMNGGDLIAVGSSGMAQMVSANSTQNNVGIYLSSTYNGDFSIVDANNKEVISYSPTKSYSSIIISSNKLKSGSTYTLKINGSTYTTFTISSVSTTVGNQGFGAGGRRPGR